ncbi:MAG: AAA family ATPase [Planctomycetota bacterium]|nr:AAA family ATPase [Planctomycetota bacterium]
MNFDAILRDLLDPAAHPVGSSAPVLVQTHASAVVLVGDDVYKLKKPVDLGFLDYSTLARRKSMCEAEVELNRRLAPGVYQGVVPITERAGHAVLRGAGAPIEHAVHMKRLSEEASLASRVMAAPVDPVLIDRIGRTIARFHRVARRGPEIARWAEFDRVRENCRENLAGLAPHAESIAPIEEFLRLQLETEAELEAQRARIELRVRENVPCETHGDLRLEHVYLLEGGEIAIIDCIEFSPRYACADPIADIAFLAMDLRAHGAWSEARALLASYFEESRDEGGRVLVPLYTSYRSAVRAKVRALQARTPGILTDQRAKALQLARAHVQLAVGELAPAGERPCLLLVGGLPGTGKSVLSGGLARTAGVTWLRADAIRKELAGLDPRESGRSEVRSGIYTPEWNERTYGECLARAKTLLFAGQRVLVDASFKEERRRAAFLAAAREWGVPAFFLECRSSPELVRGRLEGRVGDPSDADWGIYEHVSRTWEALGPRTAAIHAVIDTSGPRETSLARALAALTLAGLHGDGRSGLA